jgi:uncharacterized protein (DUF1330 family)
MPAYLIVEHKVTDPEKFRQYGAKVMPLIAKHGAARSGRRIIGCRTEFPS